MQIVHVSAECYPVAKVGGLGDVVGSLPRFLNELGHDTSVVMPMYRSSICITMTGKWCIRLHPTWAIGGLITQ